MLLHIKLNFDNVVEMDGNWIRLSEFSQISTNRPNLDPAKFHNLCWIVYFRFPPCFS